MAAGSWIGPRLKQGWIEFGMAMWTWELQGDEEGLFESKYERVLQGRAAKMRCLIRRKTGTVFEGEWKAVPTGMAKCSCKFATSASG